MAIAVAGQANKRNGFKGLKVPSRAQRVKRARAASLKAVNIGCKSGQPKRRLGLFGLRGMFLIALQSIGRTS